MFFGRSSAGKDVEAGLVFWCEEVFATGFVAEGFEVFYQPVAYFLLVAGDGRNGDEGFVEDEEGVAVGRRIVRGR